MTNAQGKEFSAAATTLRVSTFEDSISTVILLNFFLSQIFPLITVQATYKIPLMEDLVNTSSTSQL